MNQIQRFRREEQAKSQDRSLQEKDQKEAEIYFRKLQRLEIGILIGELEITGQRRQIQLLQNKIQIIRQEKRQNNGDNENWSQSQQLIIEYKCDSKECQKNFQKYSELKLHRLLLHSNNQKWKQGMLFRMSLSIQQYCCIIFTWEALYSETDIGSISPYMTIILEEISNFHLAYLVFYGCRIIGQTGIAINRSVQEFSSHKNYFVEYHPRRNRLTHNLVYEEFEMIVEDWVNLQRQYEANDGALLPITKQ